MATKISIDNFLKAESIAVYGVSRKGKKFGNFAYRELKKKGYTVYPVHPEASELEGDPSFKNLSEIGSNVDAAFVNLPPEQTTRVVQELTQAGIKNLWIQQGAESEEALEFCKSQGVDPVHGECILMYADPSGFHKLHRWIWQALGKVPK